jgi:hypothetical protein
MQLHGINSMVEDELFDLFALTAINSMSASTFKLFQKESLLRNYSNDLKDSFSFYSSEEFARNYMRRCLIPNANFIDYMPKLVDTSSGSVLASIRFKGLDIKKPFIEIYGSTFKLTSNDAIVLQELAVAFRIFDTKTLRHYNFSDDPQNNGVGDFQYFAAPIHTVRSRLQLLTYPRGIQIVREKDMTFIDSYHLVYDEIESSPEFEGIVERESIEDLKEYVLAGRLVSAYHNGVWVGLLAAEPRKEKCFKGLFVMEEVVAKAYRRLGVAVSMQKYLVDEIATEADETIFGHISDRNPASMNTALKAGRQMLGTSYFLTIE